MAALRSGASAAPLRSICAWTGGSPPAVVSGNQCKPTCTNRSCWGKEVAVLKEGALAAAARAQAVRGCAHLMSERRTGGDLAAGSPHEPGWISQAKILKNLTVRQQSGKDSSLPQIAQI